MSRVEAVIVLTLGIGILAELSHRYLTELKRKHFLGLVLVLMPVGFAALGFELPSWLVAAHVIAGLVTLMVVFKRTIRSEVVRGSQS